MLVLLIGTWKLTAYRGKDAAMHMPTQNQVIKMVGQFKPHKMVGVDGGGTRHACCTE